MEKKNNQETVKVAVNEEKKGNPSSVKSLPKIPLMKTQVKQIINPTRTKGVRKMGGVSSTEISKPPRITPNQPNMTAHLNKSANINKVFQPSGVVKDKRLVTNPVNTSLIGRGSIGNFQLSSNILAGIRNQVLLRGLANQGVRGIPQVNQTTYQSTIPQRSIPQQVQQHHPPTKEYLEPQVFYGPTYDSNVYFPTPQGTKVQVPKPDIYELDYNQHQYCLGINKVHDTKN